MTTILRLHADTATNVSAYTGPAGELVMDTTNDQLHLQDGSTAGGRLVLVFASSPSNGQVPIGNATDFVAAVPSASQALLVTSGPGSLTVGHQYPLAVGQQVVGPFSTVETYFTATFKIPANTLQAGMRFRAYVKGICTSSVVTTVTTNVRLGTAGTVSDTVLQALSSTSASGGGGASYLQFVDVIVRSIGATGTVEAFVDQISAASANGLANTVNLLMAGPTLLTVDTTHDLFLGISTVTGSTSCVINGVNFSVIEAVR